MKRGTVLFVVALIVYSGVGDCRSEEYFRPGGDVLSAKLLLNTERMQAVFQRPESVRLPALLPQTSVDYAPLTLDTLIGLAFRWAQPAAVLMRKARARDTMTLRQEINRDVRLFQAMRKALEVAVEKKEVRKI
ncbi:MAG: hypothetical protein NC924_06155 [Candidatus Omnitrophica bacterium]|nr:hypothetical protein [Candidatus Omnitrophota bacterium]